MTMYYDPYRINMADIFDQTLDRLCERIADGLNVDKAKVLKAAKTTKKPSKDEESEDEKPKDKKKKEESDSEDEKPKDKKKKTSKKDESDSEEEEKPKKKKENGKKKDESDSEEEEKSKKGKGKEEKGKEDPKKALKKINANPFTGKDDKKWKMSEDRCVWNEKNGKCLGMLNKGDKLVPLTDKLYKYYKDMEVKFEASALPVKDKEKDKKKKKEESESESDESEDDAVMKD